MSLKYDANYLLWNMIKLFQIDAYNEYLMNLAVRRRNDNIICVSARLNEAITCGQHKLALWLCVKWAKMLARHYINNM